MEKILLEIADLEGSIETADSAQADIIKQLKEDLKQLQAAHEQATSGMENFKDEKREINDSLDRMNDSFGNRID